MASNSDLLPFLAHNNLFNFPHTLLTTILDHPIRITGLDCCRNFSNCVVTACHKSTNYIILVKIMHKVISKNFVVEDIYKSRTSRTNSKTPPNPLKIHVNGLIDHYVYPCFKFEYRKFPVFSVLSNATNQLRLFTKSREN
jgi:hypothetical protein